MPMEPERFVIKLERQGQKYGGVDRNQNFHERGERDGGRDEPGISTTWSAGEAHSVDDVLRILSGSV
jgi:hypothetical protein